MNNRCEGCVHYEARCIRSNLTGIVTVLHHCRLKMAWLGVDSFRRGCHLHKPFEP